MNLTTNPFTSDVLTLSREDLRSLADGKELQVSALVIRMEQPDVEYRVRTFEHSEGPIYCPHLAPATEIQPPNIRLVFDGNTGKLKKAEVIE